MKPKRSPKKSPTSGSQTIPASSQATAESTPSRPPETAAPITTVAAEISRSVATAVVETKPVTAPPKAVAKVEAAPTETPIIANPSAAAASTPTASSTSSTSAPAPLLSLGDMLESIQLDTPSAKPAAVAIHPVAETASKKIVESPAPATPAAPVEEKKNPPPAAPPVPRVDKKISEERIVKELPVMQVPEPKPNPATAAAVEPPPARHLQPMFVVMITPELAPVAKVGGLGDVTFGLARELEMRGNAVEIILPKYDCMRYHHIWGLSKAYENLQVPWFGGVISTTVWFGFVHGRKCYFIDPHSQDKFFNRGIFYGHADDVMRFAFFCRAAMEFLFKTGKQPDIIHCHDWQTALAPVLLWEMYQHLGMRHPRVCFTIHNFKHQGLTGEHVLRATGLNRPEHFFNYERLRDNHNAQALNLMKGGIVYANFVTTVSPRHAWEAKDGGQAFGLEPTLHTHHSKYGGVLNGLDYDMFNPEKDPHIPAHFNAKTVQKKYENKSALRKRLWLADNEKPIIAFIGRLDPQKGPELVRHAIFYALNQRAQFVLLGESPDKSINDHFWGLKKHLNDSPDCHLEIGYSDELAHLIYAGADMMVVPSRFEPCGLTQLISLRYGTVPIVRAVGGLADTVFDKDFASRPLHERNGYVFHDANDAGIESALHRAIGCYYQFPEHFRHLMVNGMNCDYSWNHPGQHYMNIYDYIREK